MGKKVEQVSASAERVRELRAELARCRAAAAKSQGGREWEDLPNVNASLARSREQLRSLKVKEITGEATADDYAAARAEYETLLARREELEEKRAEYEGVQQHIRSTIWSATAEVKREEQNVLRELAEQDRAATTEAIRALGLALALALEASGHNASVNAIEREFGRRLKDVVSGGELAEYRETTLTQAGCR